MLRWWTCDKYNDCGDNSDELASYGTICGMYGQLFPVNNVL